MIKELAIYGAGKGGITAMETALLNTYNIHCFIDDYDNNKMIGSIPVVPFSEFINFGKLLGIHIAIFDRNIRGELSIKLKKNLITLIHPNAHVSNSTVIEKGCHIKAGAVIDTNTMIGYSTIIDNNATIAHDCTIGNYCHISPGASLGSSIKIGHGTLIGIGVNILTGVKIGNNVTVISGTTIFKDIPDNTIYGRRKI